MTDMSEIGLNTTLHHARLLLPVRLVNHWGQSLERLGFFFFDLSEESLLTAAQRQAGLSDWGDGSFRAGLRILLAAFEEEARLSFIGRMGLWKKFARLLTNRLLVQACLSRQPEILLIPLPRPLFICGLPRTGTTFLQRLLAQDPAHRFLRCWEGHRPAPWPGEPPDQPQARLAETRRDLRLVHWATPAYAKIIHPIEATWPEECLQLLEHTFSCHIIFEHLGYIPSYAGWLDQQDMVPAYRYFRQLLQLLQWQAPGPRWLLKTPAHLFALEALLTVFPDAHIIQTHRDPVEAIPSFCSLYGVIWKVLNQEVDLHELGRYILARSEVALDRALAVRQRANPAQFYDVRYEELIQDPLGTVQRIYDYFGYPFEAAEPMERWLAANPQHKHGVHRYTPQQFGLDPAGLYERFSAYRREFLG